MLKKVSINLDNTLPNGLEVNIDGNIVQNVSKVSFSKSRDCVGTVILELFPQEIEFKGDNIKVAKGALIILEKRRIGINECYSCY